MEEIKKASVEDYQRNKQNSIFNIDCIIDEEYFQEEERLLDLRRRYFYMSKTLGEEVNILQDKYVAVVNELRRQKAINRRLEKENYNLKKTKRRK